MGVITTAVLSWSGDLTFLADSTVTRRLVTLAGGANALDVERATTFRNALAIIPRHALVGWGTKSYGQLFDWVSVQSQGWLGNVVLRVLMDTGVVGLLLFSGVVGGVIWKAMPHLRRQDEPRDIVPFVMLLSLFVCFLLTDGSVLAYFWLVLGLLRSVTTLSEKETRSGAALETSAVKTPKVEAQTPQPMPARTLLKPTVRGSYD
jgi:O-antigen ligase